MIKNLEQGERILAQIKTWINQCEEMQQLVASSQYSVLDERGSHMVAELEALYEEVLPLKEEETTLVIDIMCESVTDSLKRILRLAKARSSKTGDKIAFELMPLLEEMYAHFYYRGCIYPDKEKVNQYLRTEKPNVYGNRYLKNARATGTYKYDLSIIVVAYNKLELTKLCVESILQYAPKDVNYELILLNHGSTDGTREYFESIGATKQLDILRNGAGIHTVRRITEGKYQLMVSNDVLVTPYAIENMIKCMESDEKIQLVVPSTPNVSNMQSIPGNYKNIQEMYAFALKNNKSDPRRWEQRVRLCDPIVLTKEAWDLLSYTPYFDNWLSFSFPDDRTSLALRRMGYKMMLAKDAYCYHFGSMTLKNQIDAYKDQEGNQGAKSFYEKGRQEFMEECGVDPWGTGLCWSPSLIQMMDCYRTQHTEILGVNCGLGSNPLKVKDYIKELTYNLDVTVYNVVDEVRYIPDLVGVSDRVQLITMITEILRIFEGKQFDYILIEDNFESCSNVTELVRRIYEQLLRKNGVLAFKVTHVELQTLLKKLYPDMKQSYEWCMLTK